MSVNKFKRGNRWVTVEELRKLNNPAPVVEEEVVVEEVVEDEEVVVDEEELIEEDLDLDGARAAYEEQEGKEVPVNKKNDLEWIKSKLNT